MVVSFVKMVGIGIGGGGGMGKGGDGGRGGGIFGWSKNLGWSCAELGERLS